MRKEKRIKRINKKWKEKFKYFPIAKYDIQWINFRLYHSIYLNSDNKILSHKKKLIYCFKLHEKEISQAMTRVEMLASYRYTKDRKDKKWMDRLRSVSKNHHHLGWPLRERTTLSFIWEMCTKFFLKNIHDPIEHWSCILSIKRKYGTLLAI